MVAILHVHGFRKTADFLLERAEPPGWNLGMFPVTMLQYYDPSSDDTKLVMPAITSS